MFSIASKGFTIIELVVVIAIISVLATIVLVGVSGYIKKGKDASIKANLSSAVVAGTVFFESNGSYDGLCADVPSGFLAAFNAASAQKKTGGSANCADNESAWAASVQLSNPSGGAKNGWWCVDSAGGKKEVASEPGAVTACP